MWKLVYTLQQDYYVWYSEEESRPIVLAMYTFCWCIKRNNPAAKASVLNCGCGPLLSIVQRCRQFVSLWSAGELSQFPAPTHGTTFHPMSHLHRHSRFSDSVLRHSCSPTHTHQTSSFDLHIFLRHLRTYSNNWHYLGHIKIIRHTWWRWWIVLLEH